MEGMVVSNAMQKTVVVECTRVVRHPQYKKLMRKRARYQAHDEKGQCKVGDRVMIEETRPLSKCKRWRVREIIEEGA